MDVTLVQDSQHNVDRYHGGQEQPAFVGQRIAKGGGRALEARGDTLRHADFAPNVFDFLNGVAEGSSLSQVEGDRGRGELALVIERERRGVRFEMGKSGQGNLFSRIGLDVKTPESARVLAALVRHFQ